MAVEPKKLLITKYSTEQLIAVIRNSKCPTEIMLFKDEERLGWNLASVVLSLKADCRISVIAEKRLFLGQYASDANYPVAVWVGDRAELFAGMRSHDTDYGAEAIALFAEVHHIGDTDCVFAATYEFGGFPKTYESILKTPPRIDFRRFRNGASIQTQKPEQ